MIEIDEYAKMVRTRADCVKAIANSSGKFPWFSGIIRRGMQNKGKPHVFFHPTAKIWAQLIVK